MFEDEGDDDDVEQTDEEIMAEAEAAVDALLMTRLAARATRASLSVRAQHLIGEGLPETFLMGPYRQRKEYYDEKFAAEMKEIHEAIGRCKVENWDFGTLTAEDMFDADPSLIKLNSEIG